MQRIHWTRWSLGAMLGVGGVSACVLESDLEAPQQLQQGLAPETTIAEAIPQTCDGNEAAGLSRQLVEAVQCEHPGAFASLEGIPNVVLGAGVFPWVQSPAAQALRQAASQRNDTLRINSAYRTISEQLMLYRWYRQGRCGIPLAAYPGTSNHENGLALDVQQYDAWRSALQSVGFRWFGSSDVWHYDYRGEGATIELVPTTILAFQRLWNQNHPEDRIDEDGEYGEQTESRLLRSPIGGFPLGLQCGEPEADAGGEEPDDDTPTSSSSSGIVPPGNEGDGGDDAHADTPLRPDESYDMSETAGCSSAPRATASWPLGWLLGVVMIGRRVRGWRRQE